MTQIILAEDHNIVRNGLKILLEADEEFRIVGEHANGQEVIDALNSGVKADIVLADINMPIMDGITLTTNLKEQFPYIHVVILSMLDNEKYVTQAFTEGAAAYLLKSVSSEELLFALKQVHSGGRYLCAEISLNLLEGLINSSILTENHIDQEIDFSSRELEVLHLIAQGLTNQEMSEKLFLSKRTIEGHRQSLIEKTGSRNTAALIRFSVLSGIVQ